MWNSSYNVVCYTSTDPVNAGALLWLGCLRAPNNMGQHVDSNAVMTASTAAQLALLCQWGWSSPGGAPGGALSGFMRFCPGD
eukprot:364685-Chlamydomonas_euryale.AAC.11